MIYSILGFNQSRILSLQKTKNEKVIRLDIVDVLILKNIADFMNRKNIIKYTIDEKLYFSIQYNTILEDLPILDIKKQALSDRLDKMVYLGVLEKKVIKNQSGTFLAFRMGENYESLIYAPTSSELQVQEYQTTTHNTNIYNINNNNIYKEKEDNKLSSKKKDDREQIIEFVERMYALYPTKCPKRQTSLGKCSKDKERIRKLLKTYTMQEIENVIKYEIEEKYGKQYMQNFSTFLNNFPDPNTISDKGLFVTMDIGQDDSKCVTTSVIIGGQKYR